MKRRTLAAVVTALMLTVGGMGAAQGADGGEQIDAMCNPHKCYYPA